LGSNHIFGTIRKHLSVGGVGGGTLGNLLSGDVSFFIRQQ
jgi:hypothetical protein